MSTHASPDGPDRQTIYERVLSVVDKQTSPAQAPGVRPATVRLILCAHGPLDREAVETALRAATGDDLLAWRDADGQIRLTRRAESDLRRLLGHLNTELEAPPGACERVADAIREVRDDA